MIRRALMAVVVLTTVGCGTRVERDANTAIGAPSPALVSDAPVVTAGTAAPVDPTDPAAPSAPRRSGSPASPTAQGPAGDGRQAGTPTVPSTSGPARSSSPEVAGGPSDPDVLAPAPPTAPAQTRKSPVEVANVGLYTGPAGALLLPLVQAVQAWASEVNSRGGLNGHPVKLTVYDDGGDPARHRAAVQEAVERRRVVAFLANVEAVAGASSRDYIAAKRVPVIGSEGAALWFHEDPMYFPQQPSGDHLIDAAIWNVASAMRDSEKTKLGILVCVEIGQCGHAADRWRMLAGKAGVDLVYDGRASLAQPDFTAECLAARNAGAEVLLVLMDPSSKSRLAGACSRQRYRPRYSATSTIADRMKDDPNLDGLVASSGVFPYFQSNTPATAEYHRVLSTRAPSSDRGVPSAMGWVAAKLFEKAAANLAEPPTSQAVLAGLWAIKAETLGGLTSVPLTFTENQPAPGRTCWFKLQISKGTWITRGDDRPACVD